MNEQITKEELDQIMNQTKAQQKTRDILEDFFVNGRKFPAIKEKHKVSQDKILGAIGRFYDWRKKLRS